jgi:hypothetical protein
MMANGEITLEYANVPFECVYYASAGRAGTYWEPPELPELYIESVSVKGVDVTEVIAEYVLEQLNDMLEEHMERNSCEDDECSFGEEK